MVCAAGVIHAARLSPVTSSEWLVMQAFASLSQRGRMISMICAHLVRGAPFRATAAAMPRASRMVIRQ